MTIPKPSIGDWYRNRGGELFEIVARDDDDGTIEIQYFDGTIEEFDREDWEAQWKEGALKEAQAPEDWSGAVGVDPTDESAGTDSYEEGNELRASGLDELDLFE